MRGTWYGVSSLTGSVTVDWPHKLIIDAGTVIHMVDFVVARILDQIGLKHSIGKRWTGEEIDEF